MKSNCKQIIKLEAGLENKRRLTEQAKLFFEQRAQFEHAAQVELNLLLRGGCRPQKVEELDSLGQPTGRKIWEFCQRCNGGVS